MKQFEQKTYYIAPTPRLARYCQAQLNDTDRLHWIGHREMIMGLRNCHIVQAISPREFGEFDNMRGRAGYDDLLNELLFRWHAGHFISLTQVYCP